MADQIKADYAQLEQVATRFSNQTQAVQEMIQHINSGLQPLQGGGWIGRGSDAFFNEMQDKVMPNSNRLVEALDEAQRAVKEIVQIMRQAEDEASALFKH